MAPFESAVTINDFFYLRAPAVTAEASATKDDGENVLFNVEDPEMYSVYIRYADGTVEWLADFEGESPAKALAFNINQIIKSNTPNG